MKVYSIFDRAAHTYGGLIVQNNDDLCKRNIKTALAAKAFDKQILTYPEDFELYCLGVFDVDNGKLLPHDPEFIVRLEDLLPKAKEEENENV